MHEGTGNVHLPLLAHVGEVRVTDVNAGAVFSPTGPQRRLLCVRGLFHARALVCPCAQEISREQRSSGGVEMIEELLIWEGYARERR